jgi:hypothetical protein
MLLLNMFTSAQQKGELKRRPAQTTAARALAGSFEHEGAPPILSQKPLVKNSSRHYKLACYGSSHE